MTADQANILADLLDSARRSVRAGFTSEEDMLEMLIDHALDEEFDEDEEALEQRIIRMLADLRQEVLEAQASWPAVTDFDRLETAFLTLRNKGIVARHDFTCCGTCGTSEIHDAIADERKQGLDVQGYVFYHQQDTDRAVDGDGLYFYYGGVMGGDLSTEDVAKSLVDALEDAGLRVEWNGSTSTRVHASLDWKRRL